jgi:hypothetical protein
MKVMTHLLWNISVIIMIVLLSNPHIATVGQCSPFSLPPSLFPPKSIPLCELKTAPSGSMHVMSQVQKRNPEGEIRHGQWQKKERKF